MNGHFYLMNSMSDVLKHPANILAKNCKFTTGRFKC